MPSLGHNETLPHRESETPVCVFKTRGLVAPTLTIHKLRLPMWDNELTSMPSPLNFEPLQFQISCGEIGISERTEALPEGALRQGSKPRGSKKLIWNFLRSSALKKYDNQ